MLANPFNWRVRWLQPAKVPLFSLGLRYLEVHVATAGGWLTRYRPREVRNSIYRYRKIHIDYRSKFLYQFISPISIIYGNTRNPSSGGSVLWQISLGPDRPGALDLGLICYQGKARGKAWTNSAVLSEVSCSLFGVLSVICIDVGNTGQGCAFHL